MQEREIKVQLDKDKLASERLFKRLKLKRIDKPLRTPTAVDNKGKSMYYLPLNDGYTNNRELSLKQYKRLAKVDNMFLDILENYNKADIHFRTILATQPNNKRIISLLNNNRLKLKSDFQKLLEYNTKLLIHDKRNYALTLLTKSPNKPFKIEKKPSLDDIVFDVSTDKGRVVMTNKGKAYIYKFIDKEVGKGRLKQILRQQVLVEVKQINKQQMQKTEQLQELSQKKKIELNSEQVSSFQELSQKTEQILSLKQIQLQRALQIPQLKLSQKLKSKQLQKLKQKLVQKQKLIPEQIQALEQKQKLDQKLVQLLEQQPKLKLKQKLIQVPKQKNKLKLLLKQALQQKQELILKQKIPQINNPPNKIPYFDEEDELKEFLKKLNPNKQYTLYYTPTLEGLGEKATRTTGKFTGFEVRGSVIKPIIVKRHKRKTLVNKDYVIRHRRRKAIKWGSKK